MSSENFICVAISAAMWLRRDIKYHKFRFYYRRSIIIKFIALVTIAPMLVWMVRNKGGDTWSRVFYGKSREELAFEAEIDADLSRQVQGFCDQGVECSLSVDERELERESYASNGINVALSDKISYNRRPPYVRQELCKRLSYDVLSLPTASVVITFYDEPYSVLLRTIHSVINTVPSVLLKEIILVDDFSTRHDLKGKLGYYVKTRLSPTVKLFRMKRQ
jgi:polypeptide N-acetylgalactosaminyltransferase